MVDDKRRSAAHTGIRVRLRDDPRWGVRDAEVEHLALRDERVQAVHDLFDAGHIVPPVEVEDVDVVGAQLLEGCLEGVVQGFGAATDVRGLLLPFGLVALIVARILGGGVQTLIHAEVDGLADAPWSR